METEQSQVVKLMTKLGLEVELKGSVVHVYGDKVFGFTDIRPAYHFDKDGKFINLEMRDIWER